MGRLNRKVLRRGISEAVVILILIVIAVAVGALLYGWTSTQLSKTPTTEMATAEWSATYGSNLWIVTIRVKNNLDRDISVNNVVVTTSDGKAAQYTLVSPQQLPISLGPKSDTTIVLTISSAASNPPRVVKVLVQDSATGAASEVTAIGGIQY
ncbi:MAG: hypothetical protein JHC33_01690 [Ignisphaera sp.]|nr:hypothetical protein [Ignisphaera sp.]